MDRAHGATQEFLPQNLHGTHTSSAKSSGRQYVASAPLGDGHAAWQLATSAEAVERGLVMGFSEWYCSPTVHTHVLGTALEKPVSGFLRSVVSSEEAVSQYGS